MKPKLWKQNGLWYCGRPGSEDNVNYGCSENPAEAFRHWFEFNRFAAVCQIPTGSTYNIIGGSRLMQKCEGLIRHDRYLMKVDSHQQTDCRRCGGTGTIDYPQGKSCVDCPTCGGKGNV